MVLKKLKLGVMQGRLLPKYNSRYQAHPVDFWQEEFAIAAALGLNCIEFILDYNEFEKNPLVYKGGIEQIKSLCSQTNVYVHSICADYFMESSFTQKDSSKVAESIRILNHLICISLELGVNNIVIPCVDSSSFKSNYDQDLFCERISPAIKLAEKHKVNLALETDLPPQEFKELLIKINSPRVTVNYDIGNSVSLGFDVERELNAYGNKITDIHIKDRLLNQGSVKLGSGDANFNLFFSLLKKLKYDGLFVMQAFRDDEGVEIFKQQLSWILPFLEQYEKECLLL